MKKLLKQLAIDTATKYIYLSLIIDGVEKQFVYEEGINNHSVTIIPFIENILNKEGLKLSDINQIIIGIGPGSYTGVRIGVTVAKMIGYLNNLEVYTVSSLALIASHSNNPYVLALIDARRGNAFMGLYRNVDNKLEKISEDVLDNIENYQSDINIDYDIIEDGKPQIGKILNSNLLIKIEDIHNLTPNYLRITEAERNLRNENNN
ncbi:MAG: tRNA (adenosine(37)-N6)-threonylcarbamoyltransferase complex dimerization subunit type 1 TsaB [Candidatus Izemoplasmatales bacterium]|nr:tRNA (adenosine(37)-N6)-threonylcarbamoyltransferase complex dimerization subunit type 1 TsaB [Candidatus Izemoplasmatales bacterium]